MYKYSYQIKNKCGIAVKKGCVTCRIAYLNCFKIQSHSMKRCGTLKNRIDKLIREDEKVYAAYCMRRRRKRTRICIMQLTIP
jgi:hypothetical protein